MNKPAILIVEDEAIVAADLANKIKRLGYEVAGTVASANAAIAQVMQERPALVLLDAHLTSGALDSAAGAAVIREEMQVPVVLLTAQSDAGPLERARETGPFAYVAKPVDLRELHVQIELALYKQDADQRLRESEARLVGIVGSAMDAIISVDEAQRIVLFNAAAESMFGVTAAAMFGQTLERLVPERLRHTHAAKLRQFATTDTATRPAGAILEQTARRANGEEFLFEASISYIATAGGKFSTIIMRDITWRKRVEKELKQLNVTLEERVTERTAALQESEARFRQMAEHVQEMVWLTNADATEILYVSPAFETIWGQSCQSLYKNPRLWIEMVHPADRVLVQQATETQRSIGNAWQAEYRVVRPDGSLRWVADQGQVIRDAAGQVYRMAGIARDITERKAAEEVQARLAAIVESSTDAITAMDLNGVITDWTQSAERLYGYTAAEAVGRPVSLIIPSDHTHDIPLFLEHLKAGRGIAAHETMRMRKDGHRFHASLSIAPVRNTAGRVVGSAAITRDMSERRRLEGEIQRISETEKQQLGRDLHDGLTQQLTGVRYLASILKDTLSKQASPEADAAAQIVHELTTATRQARDLVHGLVPVVLHSGDFVPALQGIAASVNNLYKISCRVVAPQEIHLADADAARQLYRIAQEAINNAAKHSQGKRITVRLVTQRGRIILTVRDNGVGLPANHAASTGLGLRILKYRANLLHANLTIARAPRGGTVVKCEFASPIANNESKKKS
ncbi:MAG: PAS domain S-box protein [Verrucomicrobiota bacterium]